MKTVLITGVSSGIGFSTAKNFLNLGHRVIGSVRDINKINNEIAELKNKYEKNFLIWSCDFTNINQIDSIQIFLKENNITTLDILVNNAGVVTAAPFQFQIFSQVQEMITVNLLSVMKLTQLMIPYLIPVKGRIINISSVSGLGGTPFIAGYCASKHGIEGFSESLRRELNIYGLKVCIIGPGSIKTPIWFKGLESIRSLYDKTIYKKSFDQFLNFASNEEKNALPAEAVVKNIIDASFSKRPKIRYAPVPRPLINIYFRSLLPKVFVDYLTCKSLDLHIKKD